MKSIILNYNNTRLFSRSILIVLCGFIIFNVQSTYAASVVDLLGKDQVESMNRAMNEREAKAARDQEKLKATGKLNTDRVSERVVVNGGGKETLPADPTKQRLLLELEEDQRISRRDDEDVRRCAASNYSGKECDFDEIKRKNSLEDSRRVAEQARRCRSGGYDFNSKDCMIVVKPQR